ncbi:hypothetical protein [Actinoplanes subglobosus]|uniref:Uncharacterized protein n=1 Tax=Actinoplanes subglobosus TaxID=1547892 RepID=A0ABV8J8E8_9ACTN
MDAAMAALLGGLFGALGSVSGTVVTMFGARQQGRIAAEADRSKRVMDLRLEAFAEMTRRLQELRMAWWRVSQMLEQGEVHDPQALMGEVEAPWSSYLAAVGRLEVLVPEPIRGEVFSLAVAVDAMDTAGMQWIKGGPAKSYYDKRADADAARKTLTASFANLMDSGLWRLDGAGRMGRGRPATELKRSA